MRTHDIIFLALLCAVGVWAWSPALFSNDVLPDEQVYLRAAHHLDAGRSPYDEPGYFYPPPIAAFVTSVSALSGEIGALKILRSASLVGIVVLVWSSFRLVRWPRAVTVGLGILFVVYAPAVAIATDLGNAAGLAAGLVVVGLLGWHRHPIAAGISLGLGLAIKPVAPLAPVLLAVHRPDSRSRAHFVAAMASGVSAVLACLVYPRFLPELLSNARGHTNPYNFSLHKMLADAGLELPAMLVFALVGAIAVVLVRLRPLTPPAFFVVVVTTSLLALPILWAHSVLLLVPIQLLALDGSIGLHRSRKSSRRRSVYLSVAALLAVAATIGSHAVGTTYGLPAWAAVAARSISLLAIPYLGWFVLRTARFPRSSFVAEARSSDSRTVSGTW